MSGIVAHHLGENVLLTLALASGGAGAGTAVAIMARAEMVRMTRWLRRR